MFDLSGAIESQKQPYKGGVHSRLAVVGFVVVIAVVWIELGRSSKHLLPTNCPWTRVCQPRVGGGYKTQCIEIKGKVKWNLVTLG